MLRLKKRNPSKSTLSSLKGRPGDHENHGGDMSDKVVIVMLVIVMITSLLSLGLYVYSSSQERLEAQSFEEDNGENSQKVSGGKVMLEVLSQPEKDDAAD